MSISGIGAAVPPIATHEPSNPLPSQPSAKPAEASLAPDTVSLSSAARAGDVDHDGDSH
jgi:hypothetical protein